MSYDNRWCRNDGKIDKLQWSLRAWNANTAFPRTFELELFPFECGLPFITLSLTSSGDSPGKVQEKIRSDIL